MALWTIWLIAAALLIVIEICTQMMWALCLAVGALAAMGCALLGAGIEWQASGLVVFSLAAYLLLLPPFRRWHARRSERIARTGMDALLGRRAIVTHEILPDRLGRARIDGDNWQVRAPGVKASIPRGTEVSVTGYDSIILTVEPLENK